MRNFKSTVTFVTQWEPYSKQARSRGTRSNNNHWSKCTKLLFRMGEMIQRTVVFGKNLKLHIRHFQGCTMHISKYNKLLNDPYTHTGVIWTVYIVKKYISTKFPEIRFIKCRQVDLKYRFRLRSVNETTNYLLQQGGCEINTTAIHE